MSKHLLVLCGGRSAEHEVALLSAVNVVAAIDRERFDPVVVGIDRDGTWWRLDPDSFVVHADDPARISLAAGGEPVALTMRDGTGVLVAISGKTDASPWPVDVAFPVLHGTYGEDGTVQGLLEIMNVPYVGCDPAASANCMDKVVTKQLLRDAGLAVAPWLTVSAAGERPGARVVDEMLGWPVFVKPARLGSSVGISKVSRAAELEEALAAALCYDTKVLIEAFMPGREIECAVLGNAAPRAAVPGEVVPQGEHGYYSYEAKYLDEDGALLMAPADLDDTTAERVRSTALRAYEALGCSGMARVDFFLLPDGSLVVNEINTIPGFTRISMYPRLWRLSGMGYSDLITELVRLAEERYAGRAGLCTRLP